MEEGRAGDTAGRGRCQEVSTTQQGAGAVPCARTQGSLPAALGRKGPRADLDPHVTSPLTPGTPRSPQTSPLPPASLPAPSTATLPPLPLTRRRHRSAKPQNPLQDWEASGSRTMNARDPQTGPPPPTTPQLAGPAAAPRAWLCSDEARPPPPVGVLSPRGEGPSSAALHGHGGGPWSPPPSAEPDSPLSTHALPPEGWRRDRPRASRTLSPHLGPTASR